MKRHVSKLEELQVAWERWSCKQMHAWQSYDRCRVEGTVRKERGINSLYTARYQELSFKRCHINYLRLPPTPQFMASNNIYQCCGSGVWVWYNWMVLIQNFSWGCNRQVSRGSSHFDCWTGRGSATRLLDRGPHQGKLEMMEDQRHIYVRGTQTSKVMKARAGPDWRISNIWLEFRVQG